MNKLDEEEIIKLQLKMNQAVYSGILALYNDAADQTDDDLASGVIISSVANSLGLLLAAMPEEQRTQFMTLALKIVKKSFVTTIKLKEEQKWGQIGHA